MSSVVEVSTMIDNWDYTEITDKIFHVEFPNEYALGVTLCRMQEYYESPIFMGEFFSFEDFLDAYAHKDGKILYFSELAGYNLPSHILHPFREGKFDPLSKSNDSLICSRKKQIPSTLSAQHKTKSPTY